jgi:gliding motility-associated-like protein
MLSRIFRFFLPLIIFHAISCAANAQAGLCPANMDFEFGDFTNWNCSYGLVRDSSGFNVYGPMTAGQVPGRHSIIGAPGGVDPFGGFPQLCPNGSGYSMQLGNSSSARKASAISYTYDIPTTAGNFSILFHYAVVLQDPNHAPQQQPRFRARIVDLTTNAPLPCVTFDFTASASLPGFLPSPSNPQVLYKGWTPVSINLSAYTGRTIMLEFVATDCTLGAHFGYAYIDVNSACNGAIAGSTLCAGDTTITLTAPFGFQNYQWFTDNTFSQVASTTQTLVLDPAPSVGTVFPVIVDPYPGFGCRDTLYATITISPKPVSDAGPDQSVCVGQTVQIGAPPLPAHQYSWTPAGQVSNPILSDPFATASSPFTEFIVKTTDILTGCISYDTTVISIATLDTASGITGKSDYCIGDPSAAVLSVTNLGTSIQWHDANGPIPGATGISYQPVTDGVYHAVLTAGGCIDSTRTYPIFIRPLPVTSYVVDKDTACITSNSFLFTNTSTITDNSALASNWYFGDGGTDVATDPTKTFLDAGNYTIKLVSISPYGCKDSATSLVTVMPNGVPDFSWDSVCLNKPVQFRNLSKENSSPQVNYSWTFNNGGPGSSLKDPPPVNYGTPGKVDVILKIVTLGCENDTQSVTKSIYVNDPGAGVRYRDITVPLGSSKFIHVRDTLGTNIAWRPQIQLSRYDNAYAEFYAVNDVKYYIDITDVNTCVTTDTLQMLVLKKPGYYLPTAFTPNGDGLNDLARPYLIGMKSLKSFSVYNRWGNRIFYTEKYGEGWNGKFQGLDQPPGSYVWVLEFVNDADKTVLEKGMITIIR